MRTDFVCLTALFLFPTAGRIAAAKEARVPIDTAGGEAQTAGLTDIKMEAIPQDRAIDRHLPGV